MYKIVEIFIIFGNNCLQASFRKGVYLFACFSVSLSLCVCLGESFCKIEHFITLNYFLLSIERNVC